MEDPGSSTGGSFINLLPPDSRRRLAQCQYMTTPAVPSRDGNRMHSRWPPIEDPCVPYRHSDFDDSVSEATNTMAPTEAVATTCHVSMDGIDTTHTVNQTNREARDFIMSRFLPAAKAMACDSPSNRGRSLVHETSKAFLNGRLSRGPFSLTRRPPRIPADRKRSEGNPVPLPDEQESDVSKKICGLIPRRFRPSFLHFNRNPSTLFRSKMKEGPSSLPHACKMGNAMWDDTSSGSDEEEIVVQEVQASLQERRLQTKALGNQTSSLPGNACDFTGPHASDGGESPNSKMAYFDAVNRFSPQVSSDRCGNHSISSYRSDFSPFRVSKRFSGLPRQCSDTTAYPDGTSSCFETPRASVAGDSYFSREGSPMSRDNRSSGLNLNNRARNCSNGSLDDSLPADAVTAHENVSNGIYMHVSNDSSPEPRNVNLGMGGTESFQALDTSPVSINLRAPEMHSAGYSGTSSQEEWQISESVGWPLGISGKLLNSPGKAHCPPKKFFGGESPVSLLSPPPLPKSPSESWLWRALPLKPLNGSTSSNFSVPPSSMLTKKHLDVSLSPVTRAASWESIVKGDIEKSPGQNNLSGELLQDQTCNVTDTGQP